MADQQITDRITPALRTIGDGIRQPRPLMAMLGKTVEVETRAHFAARDREGNRKGWAPRHFWNREGRDKTTLSRIEADRAVVTISSPAIAHKVTGGTIKPKRGRALAIPLTERAYAQGSPRNWQGPELFRPPGKRYLAIRDGEAIRVQYILVGSVTQDPDPRALPDPAALETKLIKKAEAWQRRLLQDANSRGAS